MEIATPVCELARNDRKFVKFQFHDQLIITDNVLFERRNSFCCKTDRKMVC